MRDKAAANPHRARRTHQKSRLGCLNCKRRRIKCDEKQPLCSNCANHGIHCEFPSHLRDHYSSAEGRLGFSVPRPPSESYRFRNYEFSPSGVKQVASPRKDNERQKYTTSNGTQCDLSKQASDVISFVDLELFHNFTVATYRTFGDNLEAYDVWQTHIVQWGLSFPSIFHLMLALSALHLSYERPDLREKYIQQADNHFTFGVRSVTSVLSQITPDNCQKVYISAVMICFVYFGRGPRPGEYLIFSQNGPAEWLVLMHGVRLLVQNYRDKIFCGILMPKEKSIERDIHQPLLAELHEHITHIQVVEKLVNDNVSDTTYRALYASVIKDLLSILTEVYQKRSAQIPRAGLTQVLMGWLYRLPTEIVALLEQKDPLSLVILSYWAMLLSHMRSVWFMRGWDRHVLEGIRANLPARFQWWIKWPEKQVQMYDERSLE
ncbi:putative C6 finger domain protein [Talaromyces proteolyticus]|uniref:C6 finger domain protein n=1 Tax=Talaromyces proteolyticus TaxID=1131652 RepID=A0AAD4KTF6_9EURO|nr:putative C6 finger domain protein [Talaromyces proteolyticus]KAH8698918.1 putative C6 finger domain protein [Talaromyces proteolyticus]